MLTKWAQKMLYFYGSTNQTGMVPLGSVPSTKKASIKAKDTSGNDIYITMFPDSTTEGYLTGAIGSNPGIKFGSSDTPATENDYTIGSLVSDISATWSNISNFTYDATTNSYSGHYDYTITNSTATDIVIKEYCKFIQVKKGSGYGETASTNAVVLANRTVLDEPVTIPANGAGVVRIEITYPGDSLT